MNHYLQEMKIGKKKIGIGHPCFMVAEIGINFNGDLALAFKTIDAAKKAGADAVKFQNYHTEDFILDRSVTYEYISQGKKVKESQFEMFKRNELSTSDLKKISDYCTKKDITFFSTPSGMKGVKELIDLNVSVIKNSSDYLINIPFIKTLAKTKIPVILSTGMASLSEISEAVEAFEASGGKELMVLHCTSSYPTPDSEINLRKIQTLRSIFGCLVGLSDHSDGIIAGLGAVSLGASLIEKHFTFDKNLPGPDHRFSADPTEFAALVSNVRRLENSLGHGRIGPTASEQLGREQFRISCSAIRNLKKDHHLKPNDIGLIRPGTGLPPSALQLILGRTLKRDLQKGEMISLTDLT